MAAFSKLYFYAMTLGRSSEAKRRLRTALADDLAGKSIPTSEAFRLAKAKAPAMPAGRSLQEVDLRDRLNDTHMLRQSGAPNCNFKNKS
jgi:hypothetical protein